MTGQRPRRDRDLRTMDTVRGQLPGPAVRPGPAWPAVLRRAGVVAGVAALGIVGAEAFVSWGDSSITAHAAAHPSGDGNAFDIVGFYVMVFVYGPVLWAALSVALLALARIRPLVLTWLAVAVAGALAVVVARHLTGVNPADRPPLSTPLATTADVLLAAALAAVAALAIALATDRRTGRPRRAARGSARMPG